MSWIFYTILSQALWAFTNVGDRFLISKRIKDAPTLAIITTIFSTVVGLTILIQQGFPLFAPKQTIIILIAGALCTLASIPYYKAMALDDASRVIPLFQFLPVFTLLFSSIILHERLTSHQFMGFILITAGGILLALKKIDWRFLRLRKSFWYMMASTVLYALSAVLFKFVVVQQNFWVSLGYDFVGEGAGAIILLLAVRAYRERVGAELKKIKRPAALLLSINEVAYIIARLASSYAILLAPVALVMAVGGVQPIFVLIYGTIISIWFPKILQEDTGKNTLVIKLVAIFIIIIGLWYLQ